MRVEVRKVGLLADPGLPNMMAQALSGRLTKDLMAETRDGVRWEVEVSLETLPLTQQGQIPLLDHADGLRHDHDWDYVIYLTDLPLEHNDQPMLYEAKDTAFAALVSLPALGSWRLKRNIRKLLTALVISMWDGPDDLPSASTVREALGWSTTHQLISTGDDHTSYVVLPGRINKWRLLSGMVRNNRPGRLLKALSGCIAAAVATGAFGIFYTSIWNMSDSLALGRLALISVLVISALSGWLIIYNDLWNTVRGTDAPRNAGRDNASTVITMWLGVAMMYTLLWVMLFLVALAVISATYLQSQLGHPVSLLDYGYLSWLAASLGTLAGAVGSNFDSDEAIREATYSQRRYQRRQIADTQ